MDGRTRGVPQPAHVGPVADDDQGQAQTVEGLDRDVDLLVRHQLRDDCVVISHHTGREPPRVNRRVDDVGLAPEVGADSRLGGAGIGDVAVGALCRDPVPLAPAAEQAAQEGARERVGPAGQRPVAVVPGVAEWVVAVAHVDGVGIAQDRVGPGR